MEDQVGAWRRSLATLLLLLLLQSLVLAFAAGQTLSVVQPGDSISVEPSLQQHLLGHRHHHRRSHSSHRLLQQQKLRHRSAGQQVPGQLPPIVVSSSDNSYVSASPFESTTTTTPAPPLSPRPSRTRFHQRRNKLFSSNELREDDLMSAAGSSSDISTTATTTQRTHGAQSNSILPRNHRLALDLGKEELYDDVDEDEEYEDEQGEEDEEEDEIASEEVQNSGDGREERVLPRKLNTPVGSKFNVKPATIIKARESIQMGATFINYTLVTNLNACLVECWITDSCDTAIYQETPVDFNNHLPPALPKPLQRSNIYNYLSSSLTRLSSSPSPSAADHLMDSDDDEEDIEEEGLKEEEEEDALDDDVTSETLANEKRKRPVGFFVCYLFQCAKSEGFKCQFSAHNYYISSLKATPPQKLRQNHFKIKTTTTTSPEDDDDEQVQFNEIRPVRRGEPHYAQIIDQRLEVGAQPPRVGGRDWFSPGINLRPMASGWRLDPVHHASISIEQENYNQASAGLNGAIVAIFVGIGATGMIVVVVGHKMKSIRQRIAYKANRANKRTGPLLPPDADYLITAMPMPDPVQWESVDDDADQFAPGRST